GTSCECGRVLDAPTPLASPPRRRPVSHHRGGDAERSRGQPNEGSSGWRRPLGLSRPASACLRQPLGLPYPTIDPPAPISAILTTSPALGACMTLPSPT